MLPYNHFYYFLCLPSCICHIWYVFCALCVAVSIHIGFTFFSQSSLAHTCFYMCSKYLKMYTTFANVFILQFFIPFNSPHITFHSNYISITIVIGTLLYNFYFCSKNLIKGNNSMITILFEAFSNLFSYIQISLSFQVQN